MGLDGYQSMGAGHWSVTLDYKKADNPPEIGGTRLLLVEDNGITLFGFYNKKKGQFFDDEGNLVKDVAWWAHLLTPIAFPSEA